MLGSINNISNLKSHVKDTSQTWIEKQMETNNMFLRGCLITDLISQKS